MCNDAIHYLLPFGNVCHKCSVAMGLMCNILIHDNLCHMYHNDTHLYFSSIVHVRPGASVCAISMILAGPHSYMASYSPVDALSCQVCNDIFQFFLWQGGKGGPPREI